MKNKVLNFCMNSVKKNNSYDEEKLEIIQYGLEGLYLLFSKLIIIGILAYFLGIFKELVIFIIIYNIIRMPSFGLHATKSWICLLSSTIIFIGVPLICKYLILITPIKIILGFVLTLLFFKNAPADTHKRPIVNSKRRLTYKIISTVTSIVFVICSIYIKDNFIANCFIFSLIVQNFMISPFTYKIFKLPYNNYKTYLKEAI